MEMLQYKLYNIVQCCKLCVSEEKLDEIYVLDSSLKTEKWKAIEDYILRHLQSHQKFKKHPTKCPTTQKETTSCYLLFK